MVPTMVDDTPSPHYTFLPHKSFFRHFTFFSFATFVFPIFTMEQPRLEMLTLIDNFVNELRLAFKNGRDPRGIARMFAETCGWLFDQPLRDPRFPVTWENACMYVMRLSKFMHQRDMDMVYTVCRLLATLPEFAPPQNECLGCEGDDDEGSETELEEDSGTETEWEDDDDDDDTYV